MTDAEQKTEKIVYMATKGRNDPEMALLPFMHAVGAQSMDVEAVVFLMASAASIAKKGYADGIALPEMRPMRDLLADYFGLGGKLLVCGPCIKSRGISEDDLIENAEVVGAARLTQEVLSANAVLNY